MTPIPFIVGALAFGYLCGSVPFGLLFTRWAGMGDVRSIGSGNTGATNVLRTGSKKLAFLTLLADMFKATVPLVLVGWLFDAPVLGYVAAFGAFLGHLFPVWLRFKGGKGIACFVGVTLGVGLLVGNWWGLLLFAASWLGVAFLFRYSSLAGLTATLLTPIAYFLSGSVPAAVLLAVMGLISWISHRGNIGRLWTGTEPKIGAK